MEEAQEELEIGAEELKEIMDAELEASRKPLPFLSESAAEEELAAEPASVAEAPAPEAEGAEPLDLKALPGSLYTVQLMTMSNQERQETWMAERDLGDLTVARLERDGEFYYALLLGVYDTFPQAAALAESPRGEVAVAGESLDAAGS